VTVGREFLWILIGTALVPLLPRALPLMLVNRLKLPGYVMKFLRHIPLALMSALAVQAVWTEGERWISPGDNLQWLAFFPALLAAVFTRSLLLTVIAGVAAAALLAMV